jgi:hypothetical protein
MGALYNHNNAFFSTATLSAKYGEPALIASDEPRDHLFFTGQGMAAIASGAEHKDIWYVQLLPKEMTPEDYRGHAGFWKETFAFTP